MGDPRTAAHPLSGFCSGVYSTSIFLSWNNAQSFLQIFDLFFFASALIVYSLYFKHCWSKILKDLNFIKEKKFSENNVEIVWWSISGCWTHIWVLDEGFVGCSVFGGVCGADVLWGPRAWWLSTPLPPTLPSLGDAARACQPLHACLLCTSLPPTVHIASCWNLPSCLCAAQVFLSPSGFTHLGLTPLQPFHPDALTLASNSKMAASHQRGPNRVSPPLDCELLQRDLGHRRVESQHYSLPDAWPATNMCCCCFLK